MATGGHGRGRAIATLALIAAGTSWAACTGAADRAPTADDRQLTQRRADAEGRSMSTIISGDNPTPRSAEPDGDAFAGVPAVQAAANDFAAAIGRPASEVHAVTVTEVTWPDSALGCPRPGELYTQALVPGYAVTLSSGDETATYHTNRGLGGAIVVRRCADAALVAPGDDPAVLDRVRRDLADRLPAGTELILERNGPSAATELVCPGTPESAPAPGAATFAMAVTDIVFRAGADRHVYRLWNGRFLYCGIAPVLPAGGGTPTVATR